MTERTAINTTISPELKAMLRRMCVSDLRTLRGQLEWLIREEHQRRQAPANTLVDSGVQYVTEERA